MESIPEHLKFSRSAESLTGEGSVVEKYLNDLEEDLKEEFERIIREEKMLGEGRAARVFEIRSMPRSKCNACVKIWRSELSDLRKEDFYKYRQTQTLEPEEEFTFQDDLYMNGFHHIPRPIAFAKIGENYVMSMEKISGYTLKEIRDAGAQIEDPAWEELYRLMYEMNIDHEVLHRDIHEGNIMLKTDEDIAKTKKLHGELYFIDFGHAKKIFARPTPDDYRLTIGGNMIKYPEDKARVDTLKPSPLKGGEIFSKEK